MNISTADATAAHKITTKLFKKKHGVYVINQPVQSNR